MTFKKSLLFSTILAIILLLTLGGVELYLRSMKTKVISQKSQSSGLFVKSDPGLLIKYTDKGRRLIPNADVIIKNHGLSNRDIKMKINSKGFRGDEISSQKKEDEFRILVLGDSITWGDYLQAEEVYVEQIEKNLKKSIPGKKINVINSGVGDIGIKEELDILIEQGLSVNPDIVILSFYLNDSRPPWGFEGELGHRGFLRRHSTLAETIYKNFKLYIFVKEDGESRFSWIKEMKRLDWRNKRKEFLKLAKLAKYDWGAAWEPDSWEIIEEHFDKLKSLGQQHNFDVAVVAFPVYFQVYMNYIENQPQLRLRSMASKYGFPFFDLLPVLRKYNNEELFFDQCHPVTKANAIIGKEIAAFLKKELKSF